MWDFRNNEKTMNILITGSVMLSVKALHEEVFAFVCLFACSCDCLFVLITRRRYGTE